eukprot:TRINITY_DN35423_c0_g1_i1.p1 TRINITY_DN35423_c0_g1~~TRINITY_DN35423_c0_g1_i1.p1  ORF type:complete len:303 (+),score=18.44 TRINITY_DN35423_c0_g1_i1:95-1003(+)
MSSPSAVGHLSVVLMYVGNAFFFSPVKFLFQVWCGSDFSRAYRHFRSCHSVPSNIAVHIAGLCHILVSNFAFLYALDKQLQYFGVPSDIPGISALTACLWAILLARTPSPVAARVVVIASICVAFVVRESWYSAWLLVACVEVPLHAMYLRFGDGQALPVVRSVPYVAIVGGYVCAHALIYVAGLRGCLFHVRWHLNVAAWVALAYGSVSPFEKRANVYWAAVVGWLFAILTDQPAALFYGSGYVASLNQGVAHEQAGEKPNLPELATRKGAQKAADEHAHTALFPVLVLTSAYQSLRSVCC